MIRASTRRFSALFAGVSLGGTRAHGIPAAAVLVEQAQQALDGGGEMSLALAEGGKELLDLGDGAQQPLLAPVAAGDVV